MSSVSGTTHASCLSISIIFSAENVSATQRRSAAKWSRQDLNDGVAYGTCARLAVLASFGSDASFGSAGRLFVDSDILRYATSSGAFPHLIIIAAAARVRPRLYGRWSLRSCPTALPSSPAVPPESACG